MVVLPVARAHLGGQEQSPARRRQDASPRAACLREQQPLAEPERLQAVKLELRDELVSAPWVQ